jgi:TP53 regulating kinase-like protein
LNIANFDLIRKGAEANLYLGEWYGKKVIVKKRVEKAYRVEPLDKKIRAYRTVHEAQIMHEARKSGVPTPTIYLIDISDFTIVMEYIEGIRLRDSLNNFSSEERLRACRNVGNLIGRLHERSIIHGDLTTSNMIQTSDEKIFFIDFGLSLYSIEVEDRGVDLHLVKRALNSTHYKYVDQCFSAVIEAYRAKVGDKKTDSVLKKVREIEKRGRYFPERV